MSLLVARRGLLAAGVAAEAPAPSGNYADEVAADSPLLYWRLEETSGSTASDEQNNFDGTVVGADLNVAGKVGSGASFDGTDDYIHAATSSDYNSTAITVEAWLRTASSSGFPMIAARESGAAGTSTRVFQFRLDQSTGRLAAIIWNNSGDIIANFVAGSTDLTDNAWHHAVMSVNGTHVLLHADKVEVGSESYTGDLRTNSDRQFEVARVGNDGQYFSGRLDEIAYYTSALSAARIAAHYDAGVA